MGRSARGREQVKPKLKLRRRASSLTLLGISVPRAWMRSLNFRARAAMMRVETAIELFLSEGADDEDEEEKSVFEAASSVSRSGPVLSAGAARRGATTMTGLPAFRPRS
jgi:hypothetical protein